MPKFLLNLIVKCLGLRLFVGSRNGGGRLGAPSSQEFLEHIAIALPEACMFFGEVWPDSNGVWHR